MDLLKLYILYSRLISNEIQANKFALNHYIIKKIRVVKKEVLNLMITVVDKSSTNTSLIAENFVEPLMEILQDYCNNVPEARFAILILSYNVFIEKLKYSLFSQQLSKNSREALQPSFPKSLIMSSQPLSI